jgi:hypothetical protein
MPGTCPFPGQATLLGAGDGAICYRLTDVGACLGMLKPVSKGAPGTTARLGKLLGLSLLVSLVLPVDRWRFDRPVPRFVVELVLPCP